MPLIECTLIEGYDTETRRLISERITDAACSATGASPEFVIVTVKEITPENYMRGRSQKIPAPAPLQPDEIVKQFISLMQDRNLEDAQKWLADGAQMIFPDGQCFTNLSDLSKWMKTRYKSVSKTFECIETAFQGKEASVYCSGELKGIWLDGSTFRNVRFIDRFAISNGQITRHEVWNDLAEVKGSKKW